MSDTESPGKMTPARQRVFDYLLQFKPRPESEHPQIREVAKATDLPQTTAYEAVTWLRARGLIPWYKRRRRGPRGDQKRGKRK